MKKNKGVSLLLALALTVQSVCVGALATEAEQPATETQAIVTEVTEATDEIQETVDATEATGEATGETTGETVETEPPTEAPTAAPAGGCGSVMTLAILPCLAAGFVLTSKKKED